MSGFEEALRIGESLSTRAVLGVRIGMEAALRVVMVGGAGAHDVSVIGRSFKRVSL